MAPYHYVFYMECGCKPGPLNYCTNLRSTVHNCLLSFDFVDQVEWCGGSDTMEEILSRIQQREEAAVKRERAMAYAFSHQVH